MTAVLPKIIEDRFLGDGVYASFDGYHIWLDTRAQVPVNRIALDPTVVAMLEDFVQDVLAAIQKHNAGLGERRAP